MPPRRGMVVAVPRRAVLSCVSCVVCPAQVLREQQVEGGVIHASARAGEHSVHARERNASHGAAELSAQGVGAMDLAQAGLAPLARSWRLGALRLEPQAQWAQWAIVAGLYAVLGLSLLHRGAKHAMKAVRMLSLGLAWLGLVR